MRFMFLIHAAYGAEPTPELFAAMHEMATREVKAGRMIHDGGLTPPSPGSRLQLKAGKVVVLDGPFAETKEVIGGFAIFELPDWAAAEESARQFLDLHRTHAPAWEGVCEIRELAGSMVEVVRGGG